MLHMLGHLADELSLFYLGVLVPLILELFMDFFSILLGILLVVNEAVDHFVELPVVQADIIELVMV